MIYIIMIWIVVGTSFVGVGLLVQRGFGLKLLSSRELIICFWLGWASCVAFLQIWHFLFRIDLIPSLIIILAGAVGVVLNRVSLIRLVRQIFTSPLNSAYILILLVALIWLSNLATDEVDIVDSAIYHIPAIRWFASYPIVPGLGNLHGRFAFNNSSLLYAAIFDSIPGEAGMYRIATGLLYFVLIIGLILEGMKAITLKTNISQRASALSLLMLGPVVYWILKVTHSSPAPDAVIFVLTVLLGQLFIYFIDTAKPDIIDHKHALFMLFQITFLCLIGITVKLSFIVLGFTLTLTCIGLWVQRYQPDIVQLKKALAIASATLLICIVPWLVRGVILSGYFAYPISVAAPFVKWRVPQEAVAIEAAWVRSWARRPAVHYDEVLGNWNWLAPWARAHLRKHEIATPLILAGTAVLAILGRWLFARPRDKRMPSAILFLLPITASLLFWFLSAPDPRFAQAIIWILGFGVVLAALDYYLISPVHIAAGFTACYLLVQIIPIAVTEIRYIREGSGFEPISEVEVRPFQTDSGVIIYKPIANDQCFEAHLLCTPFPSKGLSLLGDEPSDGFYINP